jgi:hypothetical protein
MRRTTERRAKSTNGRRATKLTMKREILKDLTTPAKGAAVKGGSGGCGRSR